MERGRGERIDWTSRGVEKEYEYDNDDDDDDECIKHLWLWLWLWLWCCSCCCVPYIIALAAEQIFLRFISVVSIRFLTAFRFYQFKLKLQVYSFPPLFFLGIYIYSFLQLAQTLLIYYIANTSLPCISHSVQHFKATIFEAYSFHSIFFFYH